VTFSGLAGPPRVTEDDGLVTVTADGLEIRLDGAAVETSDNLITIMVIAANGQSS
jgi:hypothetical protein